MLTIDQKTVAVAAVIPICLAVLVYVFLELTKSDLELSTFCWTDPLTQQQNCQQLCKGGYFHLPGMPECRPLLQCADLVDIETMDQIGHGAVKKVSKVRWKDHMIACNEPINTNFLEDFHHGRQMLKALSPHRHVTQILGECGNRYFTEYHHLRSANFLESTLQEFQYKMFDSIFHRFQLCLDLVTVLTYLHNSPVGTRVMCDSNILNKTLEQFLLSDDLRLILNDVDALPVVDDNHKEGIKCGHREITGDFAAPEQLWPFDDTEFIEGEMPGYNEKTDIWKIPAVCEHFLGSSSEGTVLKFHLHAIHKQCKKEDPRDRPSAQQVLEEYTRVYNKMFSA